MLGRISNARQRAAQCSALSDAVAPVGASLLVPLLVVFALEVPADAIDRIASPFVGHGRTARLPLRPPDSQGMTGGGWSLVAGAIDRGSSGQLQSYRIGLSRLQDGPADAHDGPGTPAGSYRPSGASARRVLVVDEISAEADEPGTTAPPARDQPAEAPDGPGVGGAPSPPPQAGEAASTPAEAPAPPEAGRGVPNGAEGTHGGEPSATAGNGTPAGGEGSAAPPPLGRSDGPPSSAPATDGSTEDATIPAGSSGGPVGVPTATDGADVSIEDGTAGPDSSEHASGAAPSAEGLPSDDPGASEPPGHDPGGPGNSENAPGHDDDDQPGGSGNAHGHDPSGPGNSENAPGHTGQGRGNPRRDRGE